MFAFIGILGGFTTFSTFAYETFAMIRDAESLHAVMNVGLHLLMGLTLVGVGYGFATWR